MPKDHRDRGDVSMLDLLKESGFEVEHEIPSAKSIKHYLKSNPQLIQFWILETEDQRYSPAWFIDAPDDGSSDEGWAVGYIERGGFVSQKVTFPDRFHACSFFVVKKVESLAQLLFREQNNGRHVAKDSSK
jgi:hypothetical protein